MLKVPLTIPFFDKKEEKAVLAVLKSGWHTQGPMILELEKKFAEYTKSKYAVAVSSGTTALHLALIAGGVGLQDEVIVPSFTFIASANVIIHAGAKPIFIDVDSRTFNFDVTKLEEKINKKTKAIMAIDQVGLPCDLDAIKKIALKHNLLVIEDAACAIGSKYKGKEIGGLSNLTCFSFHPRKLISTGEGGMITTNNKLFADKLKLWRSHGASVSDIKRHSASSISFEEYEVAGYNFRLTDIQAAIALEQLKKLPKILEKRKRLAERYNRLLSKIEYIETPYIPSYAEFNWQSYIIKLTDSSPVKQEELMQKLLNDGIATRRGVMASHMEPAYTKLFGKVSLPVTEKLLKTTICIPIFPQMNIKQQNWVIERLYKHLEA